MTTRHTRLRFTERHMRIIVVIVLVLLAAIVGGLWWYFNSARGPAPGSPASARGILASGFIEARQVSLASEIAGRVVYIAAAEGDEVKASVALVRLDDSLLKAQQHQAEAALGLAQAVLDQTRVSRDGAKKAWEDALDVQENPLELEARVIAAQGQLDLAEVNLERANEQGDKWAQAIAEVQRDIAERVLRNLEDIMDNAQEINAAVDKAYAAYQAALSGVNVAEKQVEQAAASVDIIKVQLSKATLSPSISGVVAARYVEVGEIAQPGIPILTITSLDEVTLTVYVPESQIGLVALGQQAAVSVDSYPGQEFSGKVTYISPRAEFTPKNIQTVQERLKTVFAVKIRLPNPEHRLKPGMPADARILASVGTS